MRQDLRRRPCVEMPGRQPMDHGHQLQTGPIGIRDEMLHTMLPVPGNGYHPFTNCRGLNFSVVSSERNLGANVATAAQFPN